MPSNVDWLESLELFGMSLGLERMRALLERLGHPERGFAAIHVVGTNGKTSTVRTAEALLSTSGVRVGAYVSPHVTGWGERIRVDGREADVERALGRVRAAAEEVGATQFEVLTAAALAEFAADGVDVALVEAGLGGRLDATNVLDAKVVVLTNVALDHTEHLGETREAIAAEKLAVISPGATVILGEAEWEDAARAAGAAEVQVTGRSSLALALAASEAVLGGPVADPHAADDVQVPGRLERIGERPLEIWDGAHNPAGVGFILGRLPTREWTLVVSILADKDADAMLAALSPLGDRLVATSSGHARALPAEEVARRATPFFAEVETVEDPVEARARGRALAGPDGAVLVTGSLTLVASLAAVRPASVR
jgi:dihydrofolate synthase/folylpolyglutamate synthase